MKARSFRYERAQALAAVFRLQTEADGGAQFLAGARVAGAPAAIMNAINDAVRSYGAKVFAQPFTPERTLAALGRVTNAGRSASEGGSDARADP